VEEGGCPREGARGEGLEGTFGFEPQRVEGRRRAGEVGRWQRAGAPPQGQPAEAGRGRGGQRGEGADQVTPARGVEVQRLELGGGGVVEHAGDGVPGAVRGQPEAEVAEPVGPPRRPDVVGDPARQDLVERRRAVGVGGLGAGGPTIERQRLRLVGERGGGVGLLEEPAALGAGLARLPRPHLELRPGERELHHVVAPPPRAHPHRPHGAA
jgi:hypothetical protein